MMDRFASCFLDVRRAELIEHEVATLVGHANTRAEHDAPDGVTARRLDPILFKAVRPKTTSPQRRSVGSTITRLHKGPPPSARAKARCNRQRACRFGGVSSQCRSGQDQDPYRQDARRDDVGGGVGHDRYVCSAGAMAEPAEE
jgi:hypothetical protein